MTPDGAAWWFARIQVNIFNGVEPPHGHPSLWIWEVTRLTLDYALQGLVALPHRRKSA